MIRGTVEERTSTRLAWISLSPGHRTWTFGEGEVATATATATAVVLRAFHKSRHNYSGVHATAVGTILRPIGRPCANIMAPLSCGTSTPTSTSASVPHTANPPRDICRMRPTLVGTGPSVASSSYPFIFRPPLPSAILRRRPPFNSPGTLAATFLIPLSFLTPDLLFPLFLVRVLVFFSRHWSPLDPRGGPRGLSFTTTTRGATVSFRCASITASVRARTARLSSAQRYAEGSFSRSFPGRRRSHPLARAPRDKHRG